MKRLALIGALTRTSIEVYWDTIVSEVEKERSGRLLPPILLHGYKSCAYVAAVERREWRAVVELLLDEARGARSLGAEGFVICSGALNPAASMLRQVIKMPVLDLVGAVGEKVTGLGVQRLGLLGCQSAQEIRMWRKGLPSVELFTPDQGDQAWLVRCLSDDLSGRPIPATWVVRSYRIFSELQRQRAETVIVADPRLIRWLGDEEPALLPLLDASMLHAWASALWALQGATEPAVSSAAR